MIYWSVIIWSDLIYTMFNIHINFWSSDYLLTSSLNPIAWSYPPIALLASILDRGPEWVGHPDLEKIHWSWSDHNSRMKFVHSTIQWNAFYNINGSLQYFNTHLLTALYCTQLMKSNKFFHKTMIFWGIPILENYCLSACFCVSKNRCNRDTCVGHTARSQKGQQLEVGPLDVLVQVII